MKLLVLGSGSSVPHPRRSSSGYFIETSGGSVLLDCSASAVHRMAAEGCGWVGLDAIWISHFHLDHIGGLAPFLFGTKYAPETQSRTKPLRVFGPEGLKRVFDAFDAARGYGLEKQPFPLEFVEIEPLAPFEILPGVRAVALMTPHTDESCALRLDDGDASLVYTADTGFTPALAEFAKHVGLFLMECSFVRDKPVESHLELADAMWLARHSECRRAMLTHFYAEWDKVDFKTEVANFDPRCEVLEATDGATAEC